MMMILNKQQMNAPIAVQSKKKRAIRTSIVQNAEFQRIAVLMTKVSCRQIPIRLRVHLAVLALVSARGKTGKYVMIGG